MGPVCLVYVLEETCVQKIKIIKTGVTCFKAVGQSFLAVEKEKNVKKQNKFFVGWLWLTAN